MWTGPDEKTVTEKGEAGDAASGSVNRVTNYYCRKRTWRPEFSAGCYRLFGCFDIGCVVRKHLIAVTYFKRLTIDNRKPVN